MNLQMIGLYAWNFQNWSRTVYPKKYAHGYCFAVLCCGYTLTDFPISIRLTSLALWQSNDCPSASKATLMNMDKYFMWFHYERLHNHNKANHNKTVCIFLGIYCTTTQQPDTKKSMTWLLGCLRTCGAGVYGINRHGIHLGFPDFAYLSNRTHVAMFMRTTWGPPGSSRPQMVPMLVLWTLLSGEVQQAHSPAGEWKHLFIVSPNKIAHT